MYNAQSERERRTRQITSCIIVCTTLHQNVKDVHVEDIQLARNHHVYITLNQIVKDVHVEDIQVGMRDPLFLESFQK